MLIYQDDREKTPWDFEFYGFKQEIIRLQTGDYYVSEIPDLIIERKASTAELSMNLGSKWKNFEKELIRMSDYKHSYLILEFPIDYLDIFPEKSGLPKNKLSFVRMNSGFIKKRLFESCSKYNIKCLFFNNSQEAQNYVVEEIIKKYV